MERTRISQALIAFVYGSILLAYHLYVVMSKHLLLSQGFLPVNAIKPRHHQIIPVIGYRVQTTIDGSHPIPTTIHIEEEDGNHLVLFSFWKASFSILSQMQEARAQRRELWWPSSARGWSTLAIIRLAYATTTVNSPCWTKFFTASTYDPSKYTSSQELPRSESAVSTLSYFTTHYQFWTTKYPSPSHHSSFATLVLFYSIKPKQCPTY